MAKRKKKRNPNVLPLGYRKKALAEMKAKYPYYNLKSNLLASLFIGGMILTIWEINIYRVTFIPLGIPLAIWLLAGVIMTPIFKKTFNIYCFNPRTPGQTPIIFHFPFNIGSFGGIAIFLFMWTNQTFHEQSNTTATVPIVSYGQFAKGRGSCGEPTADITYKDMEKQLVFPCGTEIKKYNSVYIAVTKGFFGFEVITKQTLIEGQW